MVLLNQILSGIVIGDDITITKNFEVNGFLITEAILTVKEEFWDDDSSSAIQKTITTTPDAGEGEITDDGSGSGTAIMVFYLLQEDTVQLYDHFEYVYDVQMLTDSGDYLTLELGTLVPLPSATHSGEPTI